MSKRKNAKTIKPVKSAMAAQTKTQAKPVVAMNKPLTEEIGEFYVVEINSINVVEGPFGTFGDAHLLLKKFDADEYEVINEPELAKREKLAEKNPPQIEVEFPHSETVTVEEPVVETIAVEEPLSIHDDSDLSEESYPDDAAYEAALEQEMSVPAIFSNEQSMNWYILHVTDGTTLAGPYTDKDDAYDYLNTSDLSEELKNEYAVVSQVDYDKITASAAEQLSDEANVLTVIDVATGEAATEQPTLEQAQEIANDLNAPTRCLTCGAEPGTHYYDCPAQGFEPTTEVGLASNEAITDVLDAYENSEEEAFDTALAVAADAGDVDAVVDLVFAEENTDWVLSTIDPNYADSFEQQVAVADSVSTDDDDMSENMANMTREQALAEIRRFYTLSPLPDGVNLNALSDKDVFDHLYLLRVNNGGSLEVAEVVNTVERNYQTFLRSADLRERMELVNKKGADHFKVLQRLEKMLGSDVVVSGVKFSEYHAMLKTAVSYITTSTQAVYRIAERMNITVPANEFMPNAEQVPVVEGLPADPRALLYILEVFAVQLDRLYIQLETATKTLNSERERIKRLEHAEKTMQVDVQNAKQRVEQINRQWEYRLSGAETFIIKDQRGNILRKIDGDKPLSNARDLDLRGTMDDALELNSKSSARSLCERLMSTHRFRLRQLRVYRISVVEEID